MIGYKTLFIHKKEEFDICIKFDTVTYFCAWYFREYNKEEGSVSRFDQL